MTLAAPRWRRWGRLRLLNARVCWQHCWNQFADGRILDAIADQFESRWLSDIVVLAADDPHAVAYQPEPSMWTFTLQEQETTIELVAVRDGAEGHDAVMSYTSWMAATRQTLTMMTGRSLPDDLVDYAACALRIRAFLRQPMTSKQLDDLHTMYEWTYTAAARGESWM